MAISVFDIFKIGIGPSSSHTVGPMRAANYFARSLAATGVIKQVVRIQVELFGSLGATGRGHGSPEAIIFGLQGEQPETIDVKAMPERLSRIQSSKRLSLPDGNEIAFDAERDLVLHRNKTLKFHSNTMVFSALANSGQVVATRTYYSVGGGFVLDENATGKDAIIQAHKKLPYDFSTGETLLKLCDTHGMSVSEIMFENEKVWKDEALIRSDLQNIWRVMQECVKAGCEQEGILPGGLKVKRRAPSLYKQLSEQSKGCPDDPLLIMDWVNLYALAVNEENAAGGRVVTAPTNGAAGIIPAVLHYYRNFVKGADEDGVRRFFLTAGAIGILYKENASISGAEVGCQGEVGSACSMAAGALAEVMGGSPAQVENAAEIAMEHNLGLTCDPVGGLVQVPCIERNAVGAVKAINAARIALRGDGQHFVSLDKVIKTMRETGKDMRSKYKETARGGLAVNVIEVPVSITEC